MNPKGRGVENGRRTLRLVCRDREDEGLLPAREGGWQHGVNPFGASHLFAYCRSTQRLCD